MKSKYLIVGLLAGAASGVATAFLFSPEGEKTRTRLIQGVKKLADSFGNTIAGEMAKEEYNQDVEDLAYKGKELIDSTVDKVKV